MFRVVRILSAAVLGSAVVAGVAACSGDEPTPTVAGFADTTAISQEYETATSSLELPDGTTWPSVTFDGEAYSTGYGTERAYEIWQCAWAREAVNGGSEDRQAAVDTLAGFLESEQFAELDAARRDIFRKAVTDAAGGNERSLRDFVDATCEDVA